MDEAFSSPKSRFKFICSYGGRILPRPSDGVLRYVGGEIRVLSIPRSVSFTDLTEKISSMFKAELIVKYQLMTDDLDVLISVKNEEDFYHMIDEYDRLEQRSRSPSSTSSPRFRLFLFPSIQIGQRQCKNSRAIFAVSSAKTSPTSPMETMHRVRSTPNLNGGGGGAYRTASSTCYYGASAGIWYGCPGGCGCLASPPHLMRKQACAPGNQGFYFGNPIAPPLRRVFWE